MVLSTDTLNATPLILALTPSPISSFTASHTCLVLQLN
jgi:hypothetical protein